MGKILIVDDDQIVLNAVSEELNYSGFNTIKANSYFEAINQLTQGEFDGVLSDIRMPNKSGIDLLNFVIKEYNCKLPVALMSGFCDISTPQAYDLGAGAIIVKPPEEGELSETLNRLIHCNNNPFSCDTAEPLSEFNYHILAESLTDTTEDLSIGRMGMFVKAEENFPTNGENIQIKLTNKNSGVLIFQGKGRIRWVRRGEQEELPPGFGIELYQVEEHFKNQLKSFISEKNPTPYIPIK